jgi:hypothetical protein
MQRPVSTYTESDDGLHQYNNPEYYEWWYLDCRFNNGYSCVLTWHWLNEFLKPHIPTIQIFVYTPEGKRYVGMQAIDPKECHASRDYCDVKMGSSYLKQEGKVYKVSMHSKGIGCELTFEGTLPGWKTGDGLTLLGDRGSMVEGWVIPCPRAKVTGKLFIKDQEIAVSGDGYHDHNWGNADFWDVFKGWYWGRLNDPKYTIIYTYHQTLDGKWLHALYVADDEAALLSTDKYEFSVDKEEADPETGERYASTISLKYNGGGVKFHCRLDTKSIVEHGALPKVNDYNMSNWRFLADYEGQITVDGKTENIKGETIHERLLFR